ncbi:ankyrin repeat-containing protein At5g02620-like [Rosa rugosa]|uniref:ankyrin repeat-containing protein At5g02620-like n=1 Tax=Rosa rugosa TaxID=74645 RepID=UPI002B40348A|nr:ankyrin repeat-containing protein At5g02620-like [Rosa rugosa]
MEAPVTVRQQSFCEKKMTKQLTGKREDAPLHLAARAGNLGLVLEIISNGGDAELNEVLMKQNHSGETALYVAAECGYVDLVKEMIKYCDVGLASIKARNGCDAFHIASKQGHLEVLKVFMKAIPELSMTVDQTNTTALHAAAAQGHIEVVNFLLENGCSLLTIARSNAKTAFHSAARNGHLDVVKALLRKEPEIATRKDKKGQTALHMAVKGQNVELVDEFAKADPSMINMMDNKGNTALHIATRKGRAQIVQQLLGYKGIATSTINNSGETVLDTAQKNGQSVIAAILEEKGIQSAKSMKPPTIIANRELKQTVSDIKHEVHDQIKQTRHTRKQVHGMVKRLSKMHSDGLNNAINSTTVVAVLIATVAFAAIFTVPGQYPNDLPPGYSPGEANIAPKAGFIVFFIFDSFALFISLAVVVVQTSIVVIERKQKEKLMTVINKLMWMACVMVSVAFLALSYVIVGEKEKWLAVGVTGIGTVIMGMTLGTMCYWMVVQRIEASKLRSITRRSSMSTRSHSHSGSFSVMSDSELINTEFKKKKVYAI